MWLKPSYALIFFVRSMNGTAINKFSSMKPPIQLSNIHEWNGNK
jgi:hypothetical protein